MQEKDKNIFVALLILMLILFIMIIINFYYDDKLQNENQIKPKFETAPNISEEKQPLKSGYVGEVESIPEIKDLRTGEIIQERKIIVTN